MVKGQTPIKRFLSAGIPQTLEVGCEFVYVEKGRDVEVRAEGSIMPGRRAGDTIRFDQPVKSVTVTSAVDQEIKLVLGFGEFNRMIVEGNLLAIGAVVKADGERVEDRRYSRAGYLNFVDTTTAEYSAGEYVINRASQSGYAGIPGQYIYDGVLYKIAGGSAPRELTYTLDGYQFLGDVSKEAGYITAGGWKDYPQFLHHDKYNNKLWLRARDNGAAYRLWERQLPGGAWAMVPGGEGVTLVAVHPEQGYRVEIAGNDLSIFDTEGTKLQEYLDVSSGTINNGDFYTDTAGETWFFFNYGGSGGTRILKWSELIAGNMNDYRGTHPLDAANFALLSEVSVIQETREMHVFSNSTEQVVALDDVIVAGRAVVSNGPSRLMRNNSTRVYASVNHYTELGKRYATGELIKAFLWVLLGEEPPLNYLDGVYSLQYQNKHGVTKFIEGGAQSFAALEISDFFEFSNGTKITIQIDI